MSAASETLSFVLAILVVPFVWWQGLGKSSPLGVCAAGRSRRSLRGSRRLAARRCPRARRRRFRLRRRRATGRSGAPPRVLAARSGKALVSATTFTLLKRYDPALFDKVAAELDRNAEKLAAQAHGTLTEKTTVTVGGSKVRAYRYTAGGFETRIGFVLVGKHEVQLLCRAPAGTPDPSGACSLLFSSFRLAAA